MANQFDVSGVLSRQVESRLKTEFEAGQAEHEIEFERKIVTAFNKIKAEIERLHREKEELRDKIALEKKSSLVKNSRPKNGIPVAMSVVV